MSVFDHTSFKAGKITQPLLPQRLIQKHLKSLRSPSEVGVLLPVVGEVAVVDGGGPGWEGIAGLPGFGQWQE